MTGRSHTVHAAHHHFGWDNAIEPVMEVEPGSTVEFEIIDASGGQLNRNSTAADVGAIDFARVNPVTGPIFIKGAQPGDVLEVEILDFGRAEWGWTAIIPGFGLLADEFPEPVLKIWDLSEGRAEFAPGIEIPIKPFPGTIGVALPEPGLHTIVPPRQNGGNMDIRHLTRGARLFLPVWVEGALFSIGDVHFAQGDGEVCGTAIEMRSVVHLEFRVHKGEARRRGIRTVQFLRDGYFTAPEMAAPRRFYATTGICVRNGRNESEDLTLAARDALFRMIEYLQRRGFTAQQAYALCSVAVDLRVSETVDVPNVMVTAILPLDIFVG